MALSKEKITLCWPNYIEDSVLSGGSWTTGRPLSNTGNRVFAKKARSVDLLPASTKLTAISNSFVPIHVVSIAAHNFSADAKVRVRVYRDETVNELMYDSGEVFVWPSLYSSNELEWEFDNFWLGTYDGKDATFTPLFTHFLPEPQIARRIDIEIIDMGNSDGYVEMGRLFYSDAWQPTINIEYGSNFSYKNTTTVTEAYDTSEYFDIRRQKRVMDITFGRLTEEEAFQKMYTLQRMQGISKEILVAYNQQDTPQQYAQTFLGRSQQLDPISHPFIENYSTSLSLLEIL